MIEIPRILGSFCKRQLQSQQRKSKRANLRRLVVESLEDRRLMTVNWRNPVDSIDVDSDGSVSPLDALVVINYINAGEPASLPTVHNPSKPFYDADGDQKVSPLDVLVVVNHLNADGAGQRSIGCDAVLRHVFPCDLTGFSAFAETASTFSGA